MTFGWTTVCIKYILFVFNLLFVITGIILISVGVTVKAEYQDYESFLNDKYFSTPNLLIATGVIIFLIAFFGCCGAVKENYCMTQTFTFLLILIFILEFSAGISGYVLRNQTADFLTNRLTDSLSKYNATVYNEITNLWDDMQGAFKCCGVNGPSDWQSNKSSTGGRIPMSCCGKVIGELGNATCDIESATIYNEGCASAFGSYIRDHALTLGGIGLGIGFMQFIGILFSCHLARQIKNNYGTM
ncbi:CD63 antigen [Agrilus planipennis]|uniref:Tetraspanin n=1 Tax=Agrilus planipennis TaxID=224129 RepID=A0A7F5R374_AGRPL|nr:CD63 antigen [Agrilus planipennis]